MLMPRKIALEMRLTDGGRLMLHAWAAVLCRRVLAALLLIPVPAAAAGSECDPIPISNAQLLGGALADGAAGNPIGGIALAPEHRVALGKWVALKVQNLDALLREAKCRAKPLVIYLDGLPVADLSATTEARKEVVYFRLQRTNENREAWGHILSRPRPSNRPLAVAVGVDGEPPVLTASGTGVVFKLEPLSSVWLLLALLCFLALLALFVYLVINSNIVRDTTPPEDAVAVSKRGMLQPEKAVASRGTYSLGKLQAAWWFFIVLGAYLLIGIVTWDFYSSISSTGLILLGIGAGTVIAATIIDQQKDTPESFAARRERAAELKRKIEQIDDAQEYCLLQARSLDLRAPVAALPPDPLDAAGNARLAALVGKYGPNMPKWLADGFGGTFSKAAELFELQDLWNANPNAAAPGAAAGVAGGPPMTQRQSDLSQKYGPSIAALCRAKALARPGVPLPADVVLGQLPRFGDMMHTPAEIKAEKEIAVSRYRKLTGQSEGLFTDILSDANGISFHRFQLFSWTVILGLVFLFSTYTELNMPVFDTTLMGLLGLSAGTYLGLKVPEPTVPPK